MRENILVGPARQIESRACGQEGEGGRGEGRALLARKHGVELFFQRMKVEHVRGGVGELLVRQRIGAPIGELLLLRNIDPEKITTQIT